MVRESIKDQKMNGLNLTSLIINLVYGRTIELIHIEGYSNVRVEAF